MKNLFSSFVNWNQKSNQGQERASKFNVRRLRMEPLESREMLSVSSGDYNAIREAYPDLNLAANMDAYNVIEIMVHELSDSKLRAAIAEAQTTAANDLIVVRTELLQDRITLNGSELEIDIASDQYGTITIVSYGDRPLTIDANEKSRIFSISDHSEVALGGLTIMKGYSSDFGGGIYSAGDLTITSCNITENSAYSSHSYYDNGGGVYSSGTLTVTDSAFIKNTAAGGGGIAFAGVQLTVKDSVIRENVTSGGGGGILMWNGTAMVTNCLINKNLGGGGISVYDGTLTLDNSTITEHISGGGIFIESGTLIVTNDSLISRNTSSYSGGGIYGDSFSTLMIANSTIIENTSTDFDGGGGIYGSTLTVTNCTIVRNNAAGSGAGIYGETLTVTDCTISENKTSRGGGGGIYGYALTVTDCTISENTAPQGGGIWGSTLTVTDCTISKNTALYEGGGVYRSNYSGNSKMKITNSTISENTASHGGGIYVDGNYLHDESLVLTNNIILKNTASHGGGGVYVVCGKATLLTITSCMISGNSAMSGYGGGICFESNSYNKRGILTMVDCMVSENTASDNGGGIYVDTEGAMWDDVTKTTMADCTISNNTSSGSGGGIYIRPSNNDIVTMTNCSISKNTAADSGGGVCSPSSYSRGALLIANSTIDNNEAGVNGGGVYGKPFTYSSTVSGNSAGNHGGGIYATRDRNEFLYVYNSNVSGNTAVVQDEANPGFSDEYVYCTTDNYGNCNLWSNREWHQYYYVKNELPSGLLIPIIKTESHIKEGETLKLDAAQSINAVTYEWDLNNDGNYDESGAIVMLSWEKLVEYGFSLGKHHLVYLRITGNDGQTQTLPTSIFVLPEEEEPQMNVEWEYLARVTAYDTSWVVGQSISVDDYVVDQIFVGTGLYAIGLVRSEASGKSSDPILAFRGTDDLAGLYADADPKGIAFTTYTEYREELYAWMESVSTGGELISIVAHSLGGAFTQWLAADWTNDGRKLGTITTFNSPGISKEKADLFDEGNVQSMTHHIVNGDIVSMAGEAFISGTVYYYSFSGWDLHEKHSSPLFLDSTEMFNKPEDLNYKTISVETLSSPTFYHSGNGYFALLILASKIDSRTAGFFTRGKAESIRKEVGNIVYPLLEIKVDKYGTQLTIPEIEIKGWKFKNIIVDWNSDEISGVVSIQPGSGVTIDGMITFRDNELNEISVQANNANQHIAGGVFLRSAGLKVDHITDDQPLLLTGNIGLSLGPAIPIQLPEWLGGYSGSPSLGILEGYLIADSNEFVVLGNLDVANGALATATGSVAFNWESNYAYGKLDTEILSGLFDAETMFQFSWNTLSPTLRIQGEGNVNIPRPIPYIGGLEIASALTRLVYVCDSDNTNDFVEIVGSVNIPFLGMKSVGVKIYFDGSYQTTGIRQVTSQSLRSAAFAQEEESEGYLVLLNWEEETPGATGIIVLPNGDRITENDMLGRTDIALVPELSSSTQRAYFVKESISTISDWSYEVSGVSQFTTSICEFSDPAEIVLGSVSGGTDNEPLHIDIENVNLSQDAVLIFYLTSVEDESVQIPVFVTEQNEWEAGYIEFMPNVPDGDYILSVLVSDGNRVSSEIIYPEVISISNDSLTTRPDTPTGFDAETKDATQIDLNWTASDGATSYEIQYRKSGDTAWLTWPSVSGTSATVASLQPDTTYQFQVRAKNDAGVSEWSNIVTATTESTSETPPNAPTGLTAVATVYGDINYSWNAASGADEYWIYRRVGTNGEFTLLGTMENTSGSNSDLDPGTRYYYYVVSYNNTTQLFSEPSEIVYATTPLSTPEYQKTEIGRNTIGLSWNAVAGATGYDVRYQIRGATSWIDSFSVSGTTTMIFNLTPGTAYEIQVRAKNSLVESEWTGRLQVTTGSSTTRNILAIGADAGPLSKPIVQVYDADTGERLFEIPADQTYGVEYTGGIRVATGDINGDDVPDIAVAPGRNKAPDIYIFDGRDGSLISVIPASASYGASFKDGLSIAIGDVTGSGMNDIILVPSGGQAVVQVFENISEPASGYYNFQRSMQFNAFEDRKDFIGGASVTVDDTPLGTTDKQQIVLGTGPGIAHTVRIYDTATGLVNPQPIQEIKTTPVEVQGGVNVALGDLNGDGVNELIVATKNGGWSLVEIYTIFPGVTPQLQGSFQAYDGGEGNNVAVNVVARDTDGDGVAEIYTTQGAKGKGGVSIKKMLWDSNALQAKLVGTILADWSDEDSTGLFLG